LITSKYNRGSQQLLFQQEGKKNKANESYTGLIAEHNQKWSPAKQDSILKPEKYLLNKSKSIPED
jgi:hypothetical protein|tara:strand:+ start:811 stop:1005 length:195 start_codon:yes stop_codon:yes gene_type:complete